MTAENEKMASSGPTTTYPQLTDTNFKNWKFRVLCLLDEKGVKWVVTDDVSTAKKEDVEAANKKAKNAIINCVSDRHIDYVRDCDTARGMLTALTNVFERKSTISRLLIRKKLLGLKCTTSLQDHFNKFDGLVSDLEAMGSKLEQEDAVCHLLLTIPDKYENVITVLETIDTDLTLDFVKSRLLDAEMKLNHINTPNAVESSFNVRLSDKPRRCFECGELGHFIRECPKRPESGGKHLSENFGTSRGRGGGYSSQGWRNQSGYGNKDQGYRNYERHLNRGRTSRGEGTSRGNYMCHENEECSDKEVSFVATIKETVLFGEQDSIRFVLDSGCTDHLVSLNLKKYMCDVKDVQQPVNIKVANGEELQATQTGTLKLHKDGKIVKFEALLVPNLTLNLLSVAKIVQSGKKVIFHKDVAEIVDENSLSIMCGMGGKLYIAEFTLCKAENCTLAETEDLWHRRLGHLNRQGLKLMGLPSSKKVCDSCRQGKAERQPFPTVDAPRSRRMGELLHTDVGGPVNPPTMNGEKYYQTIIDDFSHFVVVYLLHSKAEAAENLKSYINELNSRLGTNSVCRVRCDNGGEFSSRDIKSFCSNKGIRLEYTAAYSPQSNGVSERMNKTLLNKVRSMFVDTNLPKTLWGEAIRTAAYQINRSPTTVLNGGIPSSAYHGRVDLSKLKVFGAKAWAVKLPQKGKLDSRAKPMRMVGYSPNGFRLWDPLSDRIEVSRDVTFDETDVIFSKINVAKPDLKMILEETAEGEETTKPDEIEEATDFNESEGFRGFENDPSGISTLQEKPRLRRTVSFPERFKDFELYSAYCLMSGDPNTYEEAVAAGEGWEEAIRKELEAHEKFCTWEPATLPEGIKPIDTKWIFRTKQSGMKKARLVARGFQESCNYDVYSPVAKMTTIRTMLSLALHKNLGLRQLDIPTAFLNGELEQDIYIKRPEGIHCGAKILKLNRALYGLKSAPKCWNQKFHAFATRVGLERSARDACLYSKNNLNLVIFVDDILLFGTEEEISEFVCSVKKEFNAKDLGSLHSFLGMDIVRDEDIITISQKQMIEDVIQKFRMDNCNGIQTPMAHDSVPFPTGEVVNVPFRQLIGCLMYLCMVSRPDIAFATSYLSRFLDRPTNCLWTAAKRILRYLSLTKNYALVFKKNEEENLTAFTDADWAGDQEDRKSTSGSAVFYKGNLVSWQSIKQQTVALSTAEAEYVAAAQTTCEVLHLQGVLQSVSAAESVPVLYCDNQSAIHMIHNHENSKRSKHIDIRVNFVKDVVLKNELNVMYVKSEENAADIFTKALPVSKFKMLRDMLNISSI